MTDERLDDDIAARHKQELLWSDEDQRLAEKAMRREASQAFTDRLNRGAA